MRVVTLVTLKRTRDLRVFRWPFVGSGSQHLLDEAREGTALIHENRCLPFRSGQLGRQAFDMPAIDMRFGSDDSGCNAGIHASVAACGKDFEAKVKADCASPIGRISAKPQPMVQR